MKRLHSTFGTALLSIMLAVAAARAESPSAAHLTPDGSSVTEPPRQTPVIARADVVVIGTGEGGLGGCTAAVAAARRGASVLLIDEHGTIGLHVPIALGVVIGVDGWRPTIHEGLFRDYAGYVARAGQYSFQPLTLDELMKRGEIIIRYHDVAQTAMLAMLRDAGVKTLFHAKFVDAVVEDGKLKAIIVETPQGRAAIAGKVFIDSTGLGDVAFKAGAPMVREEAYMSVQAIIGKVDEAAYNRWTKENDQPLDASYARWMDAVVGSPVKGLKHPWEKWFSTYLGNRFPAAVVRKVREAQEKGELTLLHRRGAEGILAIVEGLKVNGDVALPRTYITGVDPTNAEDVSWAETTSRLALLEFQQFLHKSVPGFEHCTLERVADTVSLRGGRYIQIDRPIPAEDLDRGQKNPDCVFVLQRGPKNQPFEVPYRALVPQKVDQLLVVGKATAGGAAMRQAHGVVIEGEAAGIAAAMAAKQQIAPRSIDIRQVQAALRADGVEIPY